jgi:hypothetical protein
MKQLLIVTLVILTSACSGTKKAIESQVQQSKDNDIVVESPNLNEVAEPENNDGEVYEMIEVVDENGKTIAEVSSQDEAKALVKTQNDSITFNQQLSKKEGYIHDLFDTLLQKYVSKNGNVNYKNLKNEHKDLLGYIEVLTKFYPKIDELSKSEKLAYWINAYNALTIDLILRHYPLQSIKDIKNPWDQRLWKFGNKWLSLNDIEHQILRKINEPRIHFAIVCASESCPKLLNKAFNADELEMQLTNATKAFLSDRSKNEISKNSIKLSKIFKWFAKDFKADGSLIDFLNQYTEIEISDKAKKSFKDYNWDLNE